MFSVYSKNKGIGLTVPILLEGSVYIYIYIYIYIYKHKKIATIGLYLRHSRDLQLANQLQIVLRGRTFSF